MKKNENENENDIKPRVTVRYGTKEDAERYCEEYSRKLRELKITPEQEAAARIIFEQSKLDYAAAKKRREEAKTGE